MKTKICFEDNNITREGIEPLSMPLTPLPRGSKVSFTQLNSLMQKNKIFDFGLNVRNLISVGQN